MTVKNKIVSVDTVGQMAQSLIERWGCSPSVPDGEDSSGKQKGRVLSPKEVALRAIAVAEEFQDALYASGHMQDED